ncbi:MAG: hypothetical protein ACE15E_24090 [Acidobacteriota bacterium]
MAKASFLVGRMVNDFFVANYVDPARPRQDIADYLEEFQSMGGNTLIAHNLVTADQAYYPSRICRNAPKPGDTSGDIVELLLDQTDERGLAVLLSVGWNMTRNSPYAERMKEIRALMRELHELYRRHPSLVGFYSWQEGSGTYYGSYVREFCRSVKELDPHLLSACAPHVDDPLLAGYLAAIDELDLIIYQAGVMASYRPDNRKKYPFRRVRDFCLLGVGAARLQQKLTLAHVELFGYLENKRDPRFFAASYANIYRQILSAGTLPNPDGISFFAYHPHIYKAVRMYKEVEESRKAARDGLAAFQSLQRDVAPPRYALAVYFPYSDWVVERWPNDFLPAFDAFRRLGVPVDLVPYSPAPDESVYPYYPIHRNEQVLARLLRDRTVLILPNVSGFQQTDSDLIDEFVKQGGVVVAFGPQIPMGRTYERRDVFGIEEADGHPGSAGQLVVKKAVGPRVAAGKTFSLPGGAVSAWKAVRGDTLATREDGSPAVHVNQYGKGRAVAVLTDAGSAVDHFPALIRDLLGFALESSGLQSLPIDVLNCTANTDLAVSQDSGKIRVGLVNHGEVQLELRLRAPGGEPARGHDAVSSECLQPAGDGVSLRVTIPSAGFRVVEVLIGE